MTQVGGFQAGGALRPGKLYVRRSADDKLSQRLTDGELCYVLGPRQIGKSSLRGRTSDLLRSRGIQCVSIDLNEIGTCDLTAREWFGGLTSLIADQLGLPEPQLPGDAAPVLSLLRYLRQVVLREISAPLVIFIDEIEVLRSLSFSASDFFSMIRSLYNQRSSDPGCQRLTFCLLGVATPADLVEDLSASPFNIGRRIVLEDFSVAEAAVFLEGLRGLHGLAEGWLEAIVGWTSGHPYMTQSLCKALCEDPALHGAPPAEAVIGLVQRTFLQRPISADPCLGYAESYFRERRPGFLQHRLLELYRRLLDGEPEPVRMADPEQLKLLISGLVAERGEERHRVLMVRNRIFASMFDHRWVRQALSARHLSPQLDLWLAHDRNEHYLLRGQVLEEAQRWAHQQRDLTEDEKRYLLESLEATERSNRRQRNLAIVIGALLMLVLVLMGIFLYREVSHSQIETAQADCLAGESSACHTAFARSEARCQVGDTLACVRLAVLYERGYGVRKSTERALELFERACQANNGDACNNVGYYHEKGRGPKGKDAAQAFRYYEKACRLEHQIACANLGYLYEMGLGVKQDLGRAKALFESSCKSRGSYGCNNLGNRYQNGIGVPQDLERALRYYERACADQAGLGCVNVGYLHEQAGHLADARSSYRMACDLHTPKGCTSLGLMYSQGRGGELDKERAAALYRSACEDAFEPDARACNNLGVLYEKGSGVVRDTITALYQYQRSCSMGFTDACTNLRDLFESADFKERVAADSASPNPH